MLTADFNKCWRNESVIDLIVIDLFQDFNIVSILTNNGILFYRPL